MSVLVKDMKMPKYCLECPFEDSPEFDSYCIAIGNEFIGKWEDLGAYKPDWCPLQDAPIANPVDDAPTIDAVEVIRCKDCKHSHMTSDGLCKYCDELDAEGCAWYFEGDFFCAYGERRAND